MDNLEHETGNFIVVVDLRLCPWSFTTKSTTTLTQIVPVATLVVTLVKLFIKINCLWTKFMHSIYQLN